MKKIYVILFLINCIVSQKYSADFLRLGVGARTTSSGNAFFVAQGEAFASRWFGADYSFNNKRKVYASVTSQYDGLLKQMNAGFSQPLLGGYNVAINWMYSGVSDIARYGLFVEDIDGRPTQRVPSGYFSNNNHVFSLSLSKLFIEELDVGWDYFKLPINLPTSLNVNYLKTSLDQYSADAFTFDFSIGLKFNLGTLVSNKDIGDFVIFLNAANFLGSRLNWNILESTNDINNEKIENNFTIGGNYLQPIGQDYLFGLAYQNQSFYGDSNWGLLIKYDNSIEGRLGLNDGNFTSGLGLILDKYNFFIAYVPNNDLGKSIMVDLGYDF